MTEKEYQSSEVLEHGDFIMHKEVLERGKYNIHKWETYLDSAAKRLKGEESKENYRERFVSFMKEYDNLHQKDLKKAHECYNEAISSGFIEDSYELLDECDLEQLLSKCKVMVITANPIEKAVLHYCIIKKGENRKILRVIRGTNAYFIFKWGRYWIAHIHQPQTGSYKDLGLATTVNESLKYFKPNIILSMGVAFGIDYLSQNIGDVIVSKKLYPYSENKRDEEIVKPDRSQDKTIDDWLDVRFVNANGFLDGVTYGGILSGSSVMSSFAEKDKICTAYSKNDYVIGGEMEGSALFQISHNSGIPCAVIKGICDWGVAKNNIFSENPLREEYFKDSLQAYAMQKVFEKCEPLFRDRTIFNTSKMKELDVEKRKAKQLIISNIISNIILLFVGIGLLLTVGSYYISWRIISMVLICLVFSNCFYLCYISVRKVKYRLKSNNET